METPKKDPIIRAAEIIAAALDRQAAAMIDHTKATRASTEVNREMVALHKQIHLHNLEREALLDERDRLATEREEQRDKSLIELNETIKTHQERQKPKEPTP